MAGSSLHGLLIAAATLGTATGSYEDARAQETPSFLSPSIETAFPDTVDRCDQPGTDGGDQTDEAVYLPATGRVFTLPPAADASKQSGDSSLDCEQAPPVRPPAPDIFGASAVPVGARMIRADWSALASQSLDGKVGPWTELLEQANRVTGGEPLDMVNRWVNWHVRYTEDRQGDSWAAALDTLTLGAGDCEDIAIAKMALLQQLGLSAGDMFLVIVRERHRPVDHAILAVRRHGIMYVLDSKTDTLLPADAVREYTPMFGYSESFAWTYGYPAEGYKGFLPIRASGSP